MTSPIARSFGEAIRRRREALDRSQLDLAWLAGVSRTTLSNIENGRGQPETRTLNSLSLVLGYEPASLIEFAAATREEPSLVFGNDQFLSRVLSLVLSERDHDEQNARRFADRLIMFLRTSADAGAFGSRERRRILTDFAGMVAPRLDPSSAVDQHILDVFHDLGWNPEDTTVAVSPRRRHSISQGRDARDLDRRVFAQQSFDEAHIAASIGEMREEFNSLREQINYATHITQRAMVSRIDSERAFERLPLPVQDVLVKGQVVDSEVRGLEDLHGMAVINLIVKDNSESARLLSDPRRVSAAAYRWANVMATAWYIFDKLAPDLPPADVAVEVTRVLKRLSGDLDDTEDRES